MNKPRKVQDQNDLRDAKQLIKKYLQSFIVADIDILGKMEYYEPCGCSVEKISEAFELLEKHYNFFNGKFTYILIFNEFR